MKGRVELTSGLKSLLLLRSQGNVRLGRAVAQESYKAIFKAVTIVQKSRLLIFKISQSFQLPKSTLWDGKWEIKLHVDDWEKWIYFRKWHTCANDFVCDLGCRALALTKYCHIHVLVVMSLHLGQAALKLCFQFVNIFYLDEYTGIRITKWMSQLWPKHENLC